jgi:8-amino-3,8-dideoxy-alpha-D-manno-octulosonate transaminase
MPGTEWYGAEERKEIMDVLETGAFFRYNHEHIRQGMWKAKEFEEEVKKLTGAKYAHAVSSGSTAVACVMAAAGLGFGDEVIVPPFTYIATIEGVLLGGGLPIFAEIDETLCLSAEGIRKAITPKTKAVMLVHMCGAAADMEGILAVCKEHNLILVEDAGQAFGAFYKGKSVGLFGVAGGYSFDFFKIATAGEAGVCVTNDEKIYNYMQQFSDHGHDHIGNNRGMEQHPILGTNFRLSELHAAIGVAQTRKVEAMREAKRKNKAYLMQRLSAIPGIAFRKYPDFDGDSATFLDFFSPSTETTQKIVAALAAENVAFINYWFKNMYHFINQWDHLKNLSAPFKMAIHHLGAPQDYHNLHLPITQDVIGRLISIGMRASWTQDELHAYADKLVATIHKAI